MRVVVLRGLRKIRDIKHSKASKSKSNRYFCLGSHALPSSGVWWWCIGSWCVDDVAGRWTVHLMLRKVRSWYINCRRIFAAEQLRIFLENIDRLLRRVSEVRSEGLSLAHVSGLSFQWFRHSSLGRRWQIRLFNLNTLSTAINRRRLIFLNKCRPKKKSAVRGYRQRFIQLELL